MNLSRESIGGFGRSLTLKAGVPGAGVVVAEAGVVWAMAGAAASNRLARASAMLNGPTRVKLPRVELVRDEPARVEPRGRKETSESTGEKMASEYDDTMAACP
jgi:hypothetical protein